MSEASNNEEASSSNKDDKQKLVRCMEWLQKQNEEDTEKLENKNDIQFIIQTHAARKNFLLAVAEHDATVPSGINEPSLEPRNVSRYKLRVANLQMECEWQSCRCYFSDYEVYQKHVRNHSLDMHIIEKDSGVEYVCLWDVCGHKTPDFNEMVRHLNYHAYHGKLLAIGFNGRATLELAPCKKDSSKRNRIPLQVNDYVCMWVGCEDQSKYNSMQLFLDHVKAHVNYSEKFLCSWAGCGAIFPRKELLNVHVRTHTGERLIACYHCGQHFANNRKLSDHLRRQNVYPNSPYVCELCGTRCATEYLLGEHTRQHISTYACTLCDMSATSPAALAKHVRYRHLARKDTGTHACPHCEYKAITKSDLRQHILTHRKRKRRTKANKNKNLDSLSDEDNSDSDCYEVKKDQKSVRKYACHLCPEKNMKLFSRGNRLTTHLVKEHGAQWSFGHSRFRYQMSEDGMYRLTTTRYESLEVSEKIMDGCSSPNVPITSLDFNFKQMAEATPSTPISFEITLKNEGDDEMEVDQKTVIKDSGVEILMCDVDEHGNIISSEVIDNKSDLIPKLER